MQCPYCKKENPEHPKVCALCGYDPTVPYKPPTSEATRAAWLSFALAILSFFALLITAIPAIIFACIALKQIRRSTDRLKGRWLARASIVISIFTSVIVPVVLFYLWSLDAPPIPNDYTIADLRSAPADCAESYTLLKSFCPAEPYASRGEAIGLSEDDDDMIDQLWITAYEMGDPKAVKALRDNEKVLELMWNKTRQARTVLTKLAGFTEIADLADPSLESNPLPMDLIAMARLNQAYLYMQINRGDSKLCIKELVELDSVIRKLAVNARLATARVVCLICLPLDIKTANTIANRPDVSQESIELLATHFTPLADEAASMRNHILYAYLSFKGIVEGPAEWPRMLGSKIGFKKNSTIRLYRNYVDYYLATLDGKTVTTTDGFSVWPNAYPELSPVSLKPGEKLPIIYWCYNPKGSSIMRTINFDTSSFRSTRVKIESDLLHIVLKKRLGKPMSLKAWAYSDEYIVDVKGKEIFSPGRDGKIGTADDISLPINPAVLGWGDGDE